MHPMQLDMDPKKEKQASPKNLPQMQIPLLGSGANQEMREVAE